LLQPLGEQTEPVPVPEQDLHRVCLPATEGEEMTRERIHLALGRTDMRKGFDSLAVLVQETLKKDPITLPPVDGDSGSTKLAEAERSIRRRHALYIGGSHHWQAACSLELANAVDLAAYTGLRLGDLIRLAWSHVGDDAIVLRTGKSRHRREAMIPLYDDLRAVLARIPKHSTTVLTSARRRPWTASGLSTAVQRAKAGRQLGRARSALPRSARNRSDEVLYRRSRRARDR
jgi:integrase